ncbi:MAG: glycoside hydrolase family 2 TIM barrel-domain containing protein, partial [Armatimonadota bacterium]|nr:glycoside hydrolase family 2 TIM barrel-domain containing protein [Armatimonadota bacterium]
ARVFLDGGFLGEQLEGEERSFDLTGKVAPHTAHRLTLHAESVADDVWLRALPSGPTLGETRVVPSVRERSLTLFPAENGAAHRAAGLWHVTVSTDPAGVRVVKRGSGPAGEPLRLSWPDARLWSPDHPNLYWLHQELRSPAGEVLDRAFPVRFGFREFRIDRGRFLLNEKPIHLRGHSNVPLHRAEQVSNDAFVRHYLRVLKAAGLNSFYTMQAYFRGPNTNLERVLSLADEEGILVMPHVSRLGKVADAWDDPEVRQGYLGRVEALVRRYRNHPCVVMWMGETSVAHPWDVCPAKLTGVFEWERDAPGAAAHAQVVHEIEAAVARADPSRPLFHHSAANFGPVQTSMAYLGFDVDLQEREEWPRAWARAPKKPLMITEFGLPVVLAWHQQKTPAGGLERVYASPPQFVEYAALYFGDEPYRWEPPECVRAYSPPQVAYLREHSPAMSRTKSLFASALRSWRAYGISFHLHAEVVYFFPRRLFPLGDTRDPRLPGYHPDTGEVEVEDPGPDPRRPRRTPLGEAAYAACRPRLAFIAHPGEEFTRKDHVFRAGERVVKQVILINDTDSRAGVRLRWELKTAAGMRLNGGESITYVDAGEIARDRCLIRFVAPEVSTRSDFSLTAVADFDGRDRVTDSFVFTVFPRERPPELPGRWLLFDPVGDTTRALQGRGIPVTTLTEPEQLRSPGARLLIGRHVLEKEEHRERLRALGLDAAVRGGLRLLVFEQATSNVFGLRLQETSPRHVFIRAAGHPALRGLEPADFRYW